MKPHALVLYGKTGCHLCEEMKGVIERVAAFVPLELREVDIAGDLELLERYGEEIPVLFVDGRKAFKFRVSENELRRRLALAPTST